jgi:mannitol-specific phosphotransferase system IIBC component
MKRTDIAMIVLIAAASAGIAYFVAHGLFGTMSSQGVKVKTIDPITSIVQAPDKTIFNTNAINPSVEVNINNTATTTSTGTTTTTTTTTPTNGTH